MSVIVGPIAPESNPPIMPQYFQPSNFSITAITLGYPTVITTAISYFGVSNNYVVGQLVRFIIPPSNGTRQLNEQTGYVVAIPGSNQISVNIDSSSYDPFIANPPNSTTPPQVNSVGDINTGGVGGTFRTVPSSISIFNLPTAISGSNINISPSAGG